MAPAEWLTIFKRIILTLLFIKPVNITIIWTAHKSKGPDVRLFWLKDVLLAFCVKMCGKCWLTHRCCRHMETQQIRLEGCPGSLLSPHRYLPPGGTWAGSRSSSQGCPGCPWLLTSEPELEQRIETAVCVPLWCQRWTLIPPEPRGSTSLLSQVYLWKGVRPNPKTHQNQTIPHPSSPDLGVFNL